MTSAPIGGIVGSAAAIGRSARKAFSIIANPDRWALYLVLFAGAITIVKKNATDDVWSYAMWFGIALGVAALLYEMSASKSMVRAWWEGRPGAVVWSAIIWAVAFGFSINNWIGAASENQAEKTNMHKAAFFQSADVRKAVKDLENQIDIKTKSVDWSKTLDAPESYDARIKAAEDDAAYEATRKGCRSKCIAKQQLAASLKADKANALDRITRQEEIKALQVKLDEAREVAASTKVETSAARNDLVILTKYAGMTEESAQLFNGLFSIVVVSILLSFGSMRDELEHLRRTSTRRKSDFGLRLRRWFSRVFLGREPRDVKIIEAASGEKSVLHNHVTINDASAIKELRDTLAKMKAAVQPALTAAA